MEKESRNYVEGDILAITPKGKNKAVSCQVLAPGIGKTKAGTSVLFTKEDVLWKLGLNGKWPNFVHRAFNGENI